MKKVLVIGSGGAGKSVFARHLGQVLDIDVIHLDALYWHPGWVETSRAEWRKVIEELVRYDKVFQAKWESCSDHNGQAYGQSCPAALV